ncbi:M24 family metallopeptidase [Clostridium sp. AM58-1XD]|uniref:M24 family metallopeptidase n=1 Tax=Clostridium sp. AM58-1XD TaxID=2292307 RepID=UPI000E4FBEAF|nr:M24 family metallopeptidase [Clostridium sp. AM58-1XD]RGZ01197.1 M24 family metallopeptidase [Clostridium sp. AM58-1XD]
MNHKIRKAISDMELRRRWAETRKILREKELDFLFMQGSNMHLGGYIRWFTDIPAEYNFHMTVLFPIDDEMTLVRTSASPIPAWALRGVKEVRYAPFAPTLNYTSGMEIGLIEDYFRQRSPKRVGYIGAAMMTAGLMKALLEKFPHTEFVDITDEIDLVKALKSEEEMEFIRETARVHDEVWAAFPAIVKPGMMEYQIRAEVIKLLMDLGSEEHLIFMGTAEQGKSCGMSTFQYANRRVKDGDYGTLLMEVSGPGGYYCESARNFSFGEPCQALKDAWEVAVEGQQMTADLLTPGRDSTEIVAKYNAFVAEKGYSQEGRLYGHSQGYDLIERPAFMAYNENGVETMKVYAGMNCSLHPYLIDDEQTVYINDNYYVTDHGAEKIHRTPPVMILL